MYICGAISGSYEGREFRSREEFGETIGDFSRLDNRSNDGRDRRPRVRLVPHPVNCRLPPVEIEMLVGKRKKHQPVVKGTIAGTASLNKAASLSISSGAILSAVDDHKIPAWPDMLRSAGHLFAEKTRQFAPAEEYVNAICQPDETSKFFGETIDLYGLMERWRMEAIGKCGRTKRKMPLALAKPVWVVAAFDAVTPECGLGAGLSFRPPADQVDSARNPFVVHGGIVDSEHNEDEILAEVTFLIDHLATHLWLHASLNSLLERTVDRLRSGDPNQIDKAREWAHFWLLNVEPAWDFLGFSGLFDNMFGQILEQSRLQQRWSENIHRLERVLKI